MSYGFVFVLDVVAARPFLNDFDDDDVVEEEEVCKTIQSTKSKERREIKCKNLLNQLQQRQTMNIESNFIFDIHDLQLSN